jgi:hypothetical protein
MGGEMDWLSVHGSQFPVSAKDFLRTGDWEPANLAATAASVPQSGAHADEKPIGPSVDLH